MNIFERKIIDTLKSGGVGVIPTDTLYGIVGRAESRETVERIYVLRERDIRKPCIVLISSIKDLDRFCIKIPDEVKQFIDSNKLWPGKVTIIFPLSEKGFEYLTRGIKSLAFRIPASHELRGLIKETGPLVAPSANIEGEPPAKDIKSAKDYFGDSVDFYLDAGLIEGKPSTLIKFTKGKPEVLRQGEVLIK